MRIGGVRSTTELTRLACGWKTLRFLGCLLALAALGFLSGRAVKAADGEAAQTPRWQFRLSFSQQLRAEPFSGRVVLYFSRVRPEPRQGLDWFHPEILVGRDVANWKPDEPLFIDGGKPNDVLCYPKPLDQLDLTGYRVQAVARFNAWERKTGTGAGTGFSPVVVVPPAMESGSIELPITQLASARGFVENDWCKLLRERSRLLSDFYGQEVFQHAAVLLPASYHAQPDRRYPVIFTIPGFGGSHFEGLHSQPVSEQNDGGVEFLRVTLDPSCPLGHHVFADSDNNGPVGQALVRELIPELDRRFRTDARPQARFLTGHSSGGWSSFWIQISHPDVFAGTWSTSPDPVDFRDFQRIDLYAAGENMYLDRSGQPRPIARRGDQPALWYRDFDLMEEVLGPGGQLHSFEAVFSPRGSNGRPVRVWDRRTGAVHTAAAKMWEKYDIRLVLERNWPTLGPKLRGKLHVHMGDHDTFYLEGATRRLHESLQRLGSDAVVEMHAGHDHRSILSPALFGRIRREMVERYQSADAAN